MLNRRRKILVTDIQSAEFISALSTKLKKMIDFDESLLIYKTSCAKELAPLNDDFQYIRLASIMRKMYIRRDPIGTSRLSKIYSSSKNRGSKPSRSQRGSGGLIRKLLQKLEAKNLICQVNDSNKHGRILSNEGHALMDSVVKSFIDDGKRK